MEPRFPHLEPLLGVLNEIFLGAADSLRRLKKEFKDRHRPRIGATIRPGVETPFWNELARLAEAQMTRYGDKANLGRLLGVPRQTVHRYLVEKSACPDAERTLTLLWWLANRHQRSKLRVPPKVDPTKSSRRTVRRRATRRQ